MSKQSNPTMIGGFVVGGVILIAIAASLFGGSELFAKRTAFVAFFEEETKGLRVGANVILNGVRIGYVSDINLLVDESTFVTLTQVTFDVLPDTYVPIRDGKIVPGGRIDDAITHDQLIYEAGLRAQLEIESFITGQLLVRLDQRPETEVVLRGFETDYPEVPTIRSNIQELLANIEAWLADTRENVDLAALSDSMTAALRGISEVSRSEDLHQAIAGLNRLLNDDDTQHIAATLNATLAEFKNAASTASETMAGADESLDLLMVDVRPMIERLTETLEQMERALAAANVQLRGDTEEVQQLQSTLKEIQHAASAVRDFFDLVERNPESLLRGRKQ